MQTRSIVHPPIADKGVFTPATPDPERAAIPYSAESMAWLIDEEGVVSRNDVVYTTPSPAPWEAMPVGGGDLSAMVRWDGDLHLHLTKSDCWGYQRPSDAPQGARYFNNVSPGHLRLGCGPRAKAAAARRFRQRLDLFRGRVQLEIGEGNDAAELSVWGHPQLRVLILEVNDPAGLLAPLSVELSEWRDTMQVTCTQTQLCAVEVQTRAARPHLAGAGMESYYPKGVDPMQGRGTAVAIKSPDAPADDCRVEGRNVDRLLPHTDCGRRNRVRRSSLGSGLGTRRSRGDARRRTARTTPRLVEAVLGLLLYPTGEPRPDGGVVERRLLHSPLHPGMH